jgi:hypothetical protein
LMVRGRAFRRSYRWGVVVDSIARHAPNHAYGRGITVAPFDAPTEVPFERDDHFLV